MYKFHLKTSQEFSFPKNEDVVINISIERWREWREYVMNIKQTHPRLYYGFDFAECEELELIGTQHLMDFTLWNAGGNPYEEWLKKV